jgi:DNA-binding MarR family transcriptional regulator
MMSDHRQAAADRLHSASLHLNRAVRRVDAEMGLTPARASALSVLVFGGPRTIGQLATEEGVRSPTMTALVTGLQEDGLVRRRRGPDDRRSVLVDATSRGRRLLEGGRRRRVELLGGALADLSSADAAVLARAADLMEAAARHIVAALDHSVTPRGR